MYRVGLIIVAIAASVVACSAGTSAAQADLQKQADLYAIDQIEVDWHKAASTKDVDLMMTLWADNATFTIGARTLTGKDELRAFFTNEAAPFKPENHWESDTPAYKIRATVDGDSGTLYFECHYIDVDTKEVKVVVGADQKVARVNGKWVITESVAASPVLAP
jgi:ketosteroid isomerase-like protein